MKAQVIADAKILIPNKEHKNFTEGSEFIEEGTFVNGERKDISGLRKGQPFVYKLFRTDKNQLIHLNKIKPMEVTEVTLGADSKQTATQVNMKPAENSNRNKVIGGIAGAVAGFAYAKYKKHDNKKIATYAIAGAVIGVVAAMIYDGRKDKVTVKASK